MELLANSMKTVQKGNAPMSTEENKTLRRQGSPSPASPMARASNCGATMTTWVCCNSSAWSLQWGKQGTLYSPFGLRAEHLCDIPLFMLVTHEKRVARQEPGKILAKKERCWRLPKRMCNPLLQRGSGEMEAFATGIPCSMEERFRGK